MAVVELGMNHPGEIALLAAMAQPTVALVNNAQREHLEFMATVEAVAQENGAVIDALPADGVAVFPRTDAFAPMWRARAGRRAAAGIRAARQRHQRRRRRRDPRPMPQWHDGAWQVHAHTPAGALSFTLPMPGLHNVHNALAAASCAIAAGVPLAHIVTGLQAFEPVKGRSRTQTLYWAGRSVTLVDDSYNANPDSVDAALALLATLPAPRLMVLGDMGEVGDQGPQFHAQAGCRAHALGIECLFTLGPLCACAVAPFPGARHFDSMAELIDGGAGTDAPGGQRAGQGLALHAHGTRGRRAPGRRGQGGRWRHHRSGRMLLSLTQWLQSLGPEFGFLRVFQYLTLRAVMSAMTALLIGLIAGPVVIRNLSRLKIGQPIRGYGMETHLSKSGTPTMGGVLILICIAVSTLLWMDLSNRFVWIVLLVTLGFGAIGWVDDWRKVVHKNPEGMRSREKYFWQSVIGLVAALYLVFSISENSNQRVLELFLTWVRSGFDLNLPPKAGLLLPFFKEVSYPLGVLGFVVLTYLVIVGSSNAVNLTDGLDGLAIMPVVMVGSALGIFAYVTGSAVFSKYLLFPHIPGSGELLIFCAAMAGAGLAFLWYNTHPAQVFMGDVGALALGGALGTIAVIVRQEIVLAIMGGIFVVEAISVMAQVGYFKYTRRRYGEGRRLLKMAPLHHHFEKTGWKESQVVVRFWIITMLLCLVGLSTLKLR